MNIIKDIESIAGKIETDITKLWGKAPSFDTIALTTLTFAGPVLESIVTIENAPAGAALTAAINKAETDLIAAKNLITTIGPTPSVRALILGVQSDLQGVLAATQVSNPKSKANVSLIVNELGTLVSSFPTPSVTPAP